MSAPGSAAHHRSPPPPRRTQHALPSAVGELNREGTLGASSTAVTGPPQDHRGAEGGSHPEAQHQHVVRPRREERSGRCAIIFVIGVRLVLPEPFTRSCLLHPLTRGDHSAAWSPRTTPPGRASRSRASESSAAPTPPRPPATNTLKPTRGVIVEANTVVRGVRQNPREGHNPKTKNGSRQQNQRPSLPAAGRRRKPESSGPAMHPSAFTAYARPARPGSPPDQRSTSMGVRNPRTPQKGRCPRRLAARRISRRWPVWNPRVGRPQGKKRAAPARRAALVVASRGPPLH